MPRPRFQPFASPKRLGLQCPIRVSLGLLLVPALIGCPGPSETTDSPTPGPSPTPAVISPSPTREPEASPTLEPTQSPSPTPGTPTAPPDYSSYQATIRLTDHGNPHILADDLGSVFFGEAYHLASEHGCTLADQLVKVRGERARFFGPGEGNANIESDFAYLSFELYATADEEIASFDPDIREILQGFVAGYNVYLRDHGPEGFGPACAGAPWLRPITERDLVALYLNTAQTATSGSLVAAVAAASPPSSSARQAPLPPAPSRPAVDLGSNGWAIGKARSESGRGMVLANPHFPWEGENQLQEYHLTVPGVLDVYGASLIGVPVPNIGFNEGVAWTMTVSYAAHMTLYRLKLAPGDPTRYLVDGEARAMTSQRYSIQILQQDGTLATEHRTLWRSHHGPLIAFEGAAWNNTQAYTFRDANARNGRALEQFFRLGQATDLGDFKAALDHVQGIPWTYLLAADRQGGVLFTDASAVPNLSLEAEAAFLAGLENDRLARTLYDNQLFLLDGSDSTFEWVASPGTREPGLVPFSAAPRLEREDYVANANLSPWLANLDAPLTGYPLLFGEAPLAQSPRARNNFALLTELGEGSACGTDGRFSLEELQVAVLSNRGYLARLLKDQVVERCDGVATYPYRGEQIAISEACALLAAWDGTSDLDSVGAIVWREFAGYFAGADLFDAGDLFAVPFDPADPLGTPNTLAPAPSSGTDPILEALARGVSYLEASDIPLDAPLGEAQFTRRADEVIPLHGGPTLEGLLNQITYSTAFNSSLDPRLAQAEVLDSSTQLTTEGYLVNFGTSFLMALEFREDGPRARALLTYSHANDPASPYFDDQTWRFSEKSWRDVWYTETDIASNLVEVWDVTGESER